MHLVERRLDLIWVRDAGYEALLVLVRIGGDALEISLALQLGFAVSLLCLDVSFSLWA